MAIQKCFPGLIPPLPTLRTLSVARRIAERIVAEVNLDDFYWTPEELPERIEDVTREIMAKGKPEYAFDRLHRQQPPFNDRGSRGGHPYGWEGISEHCRHIAHEIVKEELRAAMEQHRKYYGRNEATP